MSIDIIIHQDNATTDFFIDLNLGMQRLKHLNVVTVSNNCVITWSAKTVLPRSQETQSTSLYQQLFDMKLLLEWLRCIPAGFSVGLKWWHHVLSPKKSATDMHHLQYGIITNVPTIPNRQCSLCMLCVCVLCIPMCACKMWDPMGTQPVIIKAVLVFKLNSTNME
jgi:hypothetical protein